MKKTLIAVLMLALSGCVQRMAVMQNPKTGAVAQCRHDPNDALNATDINTCIEGYQKAGWINLTPNQDAK